MSSTRIFIKNNVRIMVSDFTEIAQEAVKFQETKPFPSLILATAVAVLGPLAFLSNSKGGKTTSIIKGSGAVKNVIVESTFEGNVRALIGNPDLQTEYDDKGDFNTIPLILGIGDSGTFKVVHQIEGNQFGGEVVLANADIITDLAYYFEMSEQIKTAIKASARFKDKENVERAYSVISQLLPGYTEEDVKWCEDFIKHNNLNNMTLEEYITKMDATLVGEKEARWKCNCSREKTFAAIELMEKKEIDDILEKEKQIEVVCHFCKTHYRFTKEDFK